MLVAVNGPTSSLPEATFLPDHAPPARHVLALVEDQFSVEKPLLLTEAGLAVSDTVDAGWAAIRMGATSVVLCAVLQKNQCSCVQYH